MTRRRLVIGMTALAATTVAWGTQAGGFAITNHGIAPGGGRSASPGGCRQLSATIAEPVAGRASGGNFAVVAGFQAGLTSFARDAIFNDGFQECT